MTPARKAVPKAAPVKLEEFVLPHNLEAERATIGAAMLSPAAADYLVDRLTRGSYFRRVHQSLFDAIVALRTAGAAVDLLTLTSQLKRSKQLEEVGGGAFVASLTDGVPQRSNVQHYADLLLDLQVKRELYHYAKGTIDLIADGSTSAAALLEDVDRRLIELQGGHVQGSMQSLAESASALHADLDWRVEHRGELTGPTTGFGSIDELTLGWQGGDLIIVGARPSIGKTVFVMNTAAACAASTRRDGSPRRVSVFSLEMKRRQLEYRMLSSLSGVPLSKLLAGYIGDTEYPKISEAMVAMSNIGIEIDDRSGQSIGEIRATCRRMKAETAGLDLVVVDYIQLMPGSLDKKNANRNEEITDISRRFKTLAGELDVPVIVLSQLSRKAADRTDPRPKLSDLRESGALEQDADIVAFLHRGNHREGGMTQFILEKQRNGPTGTVNLELDRDVVTFRDAGADLLAPVEPPATKRTANKKRPPASVTI